MALFETKNLTYFYPDAAQPALEDINFKLEEGELILLVGESGCGKTTLLKMLAGLVPNFYGGTVSGQILFKGIDITRSKETLAPQVGILFQDPEKQLVMTEVEREVAFAMENMGIEKDVIRRRLMEALDFIGIKDLIGRRMDELSTGQKQKVGLASVIVMNPEVLLLDEPTSQMDSISAGEILNSVRKIAEDTGKTIVMAEQKLERCLHLADMAAAMEKGRIGFFGSVQEYCKWAVDTGFDFIPSIPKLFARKGIEQIPLTVKEGRAKLKSLIGLNGLKAEDKSEEKEIELKNNRFVEGTRPEIRIKNLWFSYDSNPDVLKNINMEIYKGEFVCILGQNGAGKTTLIKNINGLLTPARGYIEIRGESTKGKSVFELSQKIGYLAQNPDNYLFNDTVEDEIRYTLNNFKLKWDEEVNFIIERFGLRECLKKNPKDLSTGQKQRTALASVLAGFPDILIMDEQTRGMDYKKKDALGKFLLNLRTAGKTVILVTHDIEFAAEFCDRVAIMFNGEIMADGDKKKVLKDNICYSSQVSRLFYGIKEITTFEEAKELLAVSR